MREIKINAKVIQDFNDKTKLNENNEPYKWEKNEVIKDMTRERFEELKSKGYVIEEVEKKKEKNEWD